MILPSVVEVGQDTSLGPDLLGLDAGFSLDSWHLELGKKDIPASSFEHAVQQYLPYLRWFARKLLDESGPYTADDLVQDTFCKALLAWPQAQINDPRAWFCRILLNTFINYARRREMLHTKLRELDLKNELRWVLGALLSDYDDAETVLNYSEDIASLDTLFEELRPSYREIIIQHVILGRDYCQLAEQEGITIEALRTRMCRASVVFAKLVKMRNIQQSDLRRWFLVYRDEELSAVLSTRLFKSDEALEQSAH